MVLLYRDNWSQWEGQIPVGGDQIIKCAASMLSVYVLLKTQVVKYLSSHFCEKQTIYILVHTCTHTQKTQINNGFLGNGGMGNIAFLSTYYFKLKLNAPRGRGRQDNLFQIIQLSAHGKEGDEKE